MYAHHTTDKSTFEKILICVHLKIYFFFKFKKFSSILFCTAEEKIVDAVNKLRDFATDAHYNEILIKQSI